MPETYIGLGISILYPDNWKLEEDESSEAVTLESPGGAFLSVTRVTETEDLEAPLERAREAMEAEYDEVEHESLVKLVGDQQLEGITQRFVYLDLIVTSHLLTMSNGHTTYLIQMQGEDQEMDQLEPVFDAMLTSLCNHKSSVES